VAAEEPRYLTQVIDYWGSLETNLRDLRGISTLAYELIQNADDVRDAQGQPGASRITFDLSKDALTVENDGAFREKDFDRMQNVASGGKRDEIGTTGAFGIGFIAVYQVTDHPEIFSSGRHWIIQPEAPEAQRIAEWAWDEHATSTRFRLPWALDPQSEVRRKLRLEPVRPDQLSGFEVELGSALALAALFLKQLKVLELKRDGKLVRRITRQTAGDTILLEENGHSLIWRIFRGNFREQAAQLREQYNWIEAKRRSDLLVAIPDEPLGSGRLFAVLPTETQIPFPFHINADFYPTSDRKRILFGSDYQSEWNRIAIAAAARVLADVFDELPDLMGHKGVWRLIESLDDCRRQAEKCKPDRIFATFWNEVAPSLPKRRIVFTTDGKWVTPGEARLLESDAKENASAIVNAIGISVVHPDLRPHFALMRQRVIGTPLLEVQDIVRALKDTGLEEGMALAQAPPFLKSVEDWQILWNALDALLEHRQSSEVLRQSEESLRLCAIALDTNGILHHPAHLFRGDASSKALFPDVRWMAEHSKPARLPARLVPVFGTRDAIEFISALPSGHLEDAWHQGKLDTEALYGWFEERKSQILNVPNVREGLLSLRVWPAAGRLCPLSKLYLSTGFADPLGSSALIDLTALGGRREFLQDLGVQELTFSTYVKEQIPRVFAMSPDLPADDLRDLVQLLAQRLGELRDDEDELGFLGELPLTECSDGVFRSADEVYARDEVIPRILGDPARVAAPVSQNLDAVGALYDWLGVAHKPRPDDVIRRVCELTSVPPTEKSLQVVETVFAYLVDQWPKWDEFDQLAYAPLKHLAWLPGTGDRNHWYEPNQVYAVFRSYLFKTQAAFLSLPRRIQERAGGTGGLLAFLDVKRDPPPKLVVQHLLHCCQHGERINHEVYRFLNERGDDPAIGRLRGEACLLLPDDTYVRPDQVYWTEHPFGQFRYRLGPELRQYSALFDRLGVRECPKEQDFIKVLLEIGESYGKRHTRLDKDTLAVVMRCWEELSTALDEERIAAETLKDLRSHPIIPDPRTRPVLTRPDWLFFEDRAGLAAKFDRFLQNNVIARPQGAWRAMEAAGVQPLSQAVRLHLLECADLMDNPALAKRVAGRRTLVARLVESERASGAQDLDLSVYDQIKFRSASDLKIQYSLRAFGQTVDTKPESVTALPVSEEHILLTVRDGCQPPWLAMARELAYAIKPSGEIGGLAVGIKEVLASASLEEARRTLDELGYPPLQARQDTNIVEPGIISDLGGDEITPEEAVGTTLGGERHNRADMPEASVETPLGASATEDSAGTSSKTRKRQDKLRTYVIGEGTEAKRELDTESEDHRPDVDRSGIGRVLEYEKAHGRSPTEMDHNNEGFDIESRDANEKVRYIEVKSLSGDWDTWNAAALSRPQFNFARDKHDTFWLYVVERATSDDYRVYCIQNPANRVTQFLFDDGWQALAENVDQDFGKLE